MPEGLTLTHQSQKIVVILYSQMIGILFARISVKILGMLVCLKIIGFAISGKRKDGEA